MYVSVIFGRLFAEFVVFRRVGKKKLRMTLFGVERDAMSVMDLGKAADLIVLVTGTSGKPAGTFVR